MNRIVLCAPVLVSMALCASAQDATFDTYPEGVIASTFTEGGITFSNLDCDLPPAPPGGFLFIAEEADGDLTGQPGFSSPNCLGAVGYSPGPGSSYGRTLSYDMSIGSLATEGRLELWVTGDIGNTVSLQGLLNGNVVNSQTITLSSFAVVHYTLAISGIAFDTLHLQGGGPSNNGVFFGLSDGVHIGNAPPGTVFCAGDGSGTACPCGNSSASGAGEGCLSSLGLGGTLRASGTASLAADTLSLNGAQMPNAPALYFQGTSQIGGGAGTVFGDGLRCAGGSIVRLGTKINAGGSSQYPEVTNASVSVRGGVTSPGVREYQVWYRNAANFCTASTFNLTNGLEVHWTP